MKRDRPGFPAQAPAHADFWLAAADAVGHSVLSLDGAGPVYAATRNVNVFADPNPDGSCSSDPGDCSLREAITAANASSGDTIQLKAGNYVLTQAGLDDSNANGDLDIKAAMTIKGAANGGSHISAMGLNERVFHVDVPGDGPDFTITLTRLTIESGSEPSQGGGGISIRTPTPGWWSNSTITDNTAADGSAIFSRGKLNLNNTTVDSNLNALAAAVYSEGFGTTIRKKHNQ